MARSRRIQFGKKPGWKVTCTEDFPLFLRAILDMAPCGSVLYLESGGLPPNDVKTYLEARSAQGTFKIPGGTLLPTPKVFHMPLTRDNVDGLADLMHQYPTPIGSVHIHVYKDDTVLLVSYDAFLDPFWIAGTIPEEKVKRLCQALGTDYEEDS